MVTKYCNIVYGNWHLNSRNKWQTISKPAMATRPETTEELPAGVIRRNMYYCILKLNRLAFLLINLKEMLKEKKENIPIHQHLYLQQCGTY